MKKTNFSKIEQWLFATSLGILITLSTRYLEVFRNSCFITWFPCDVLLVIIITVLLFLIIQVLQRISRFFSNLKKPPKNKTFILQMSKSQFQRELDDFINKQDDEGLPLPNTLSSWHILQRRATENERSSMREIWRITSDISKADSIKLIKEPFRGLLLELADKSSSLWINVIPEGDKEAITVSETFGKRRKFIGFRHAGWKNIPVDQNAYEILLRWLNSLEDVRQQNNDDND